MNLPVQFARRYLFSRKSTNAINLISVVSMLGMTACSAAFILILSAFNGLEGLVFNLYDSFYADIRVEKVEGKVFTISSDSLEMVRQTEGVRIVSEVLEENALLVFDDKQQPATVKGVDAHYGSVTGLDSVMAYSDSFVLQQGDKPYLVVGSGIDQALETRLKDPLNRMMVFMPRRGEGRGLFATSEFRQSPIMVWGVFVIQDDFDNQYAFGPIAFVRELLQYENEVSQLEIGLEQGANRRAVKQRLEQLLGPEYLVQTKFEQNAMLYRIMNIERLATYVILSFVLLLVAFNMTGSLSMLVLEKKKDIGILKAMGATDRQVRNIFVTEGLLQGGISLIIGFAIATGLVISQQQVGLVSIQGAGTFIVEFYPVALKWFDFFLVAVIVLVISALASWFPAMRAMRSPQLEALAIR